MLTLCGSPISNYYNKVKLVLLEKGVAFEEKLVKTGGGDAVKPYSPLSKIPYVETPDGALCESQAIVDWIETAYPTPALLPADPWQAAKVRELTIFIELHLELAVRQIYPQAFFRSPLPEKYLERVKPQIESAVAAVKQLASFSPYVAGAEFTQADAAAFVHLPLAAIATKLVYGSDFVSAAGIDWKAYVKLIEQRPTAQRVTVERKAAEAAMLKGG